MFPMTTFGTDFLIGGVRKRTEVLNLMIAVTFHYATEDMVSFVIQ
jgi:hypothetical protein